MSNELILSSVWGVNATQLQRGEMGGMGGGHDPSAFRVGDDIRKSDPLSNQKEDTTTLFLGK